MARVSAVILAAGAAKRFGRPKQLERLPLEGNPTMIEVAVKTALQTGVYEVIVVTGNRAGEVQAVLHPLLENAPKKVKLVVNERWQEGQGFSVAAGIQALNPTASAAVFMLSDQPRVKPATVQALIDAFDQWSDDESAIIFPTYQGKRGNPALFGRPFFSELARLQGDAGGREIVKANPSAVTTIEVDDPAILEDIDTVEDLQRMNDER
jgi:molybdenum cofactor cytidylyltransferase